MRLKLPVIAALVSRVARFLTGQPNPINAGALFNKIDRQCGFVTF